MTLEEKYGTLSKKTENKKNNTVSASNSSTDAIANKYSDSKYKNKDNEINNKIETLNKKTYFHALGNDYVNENDQSTKVIYGSNLQKAKDVEKERKTGHETFGTDIKQNLKGSFDSWGSSQLSTLATLGNTIGAIANKDNYFEPEKNSALWKLTQAASANTKAANELLSDAKEGRGAVGSLIMDVSSQAVMNGIDAALSYINPFVGKASFASRSFGSASQQSRDEGKSIATQVLHGAISAGIESLTESLWEFGGVRGVEGTGKLQKGLDKAMLKWVDNTNISPVVSHLVMSFGTEATEEMLSDILNPIATGIINSIKSEDGLIADYDGEEWEGIGNMLYDGLVGGISGIGGGLINAVQISSDYNKVNKDNNAWVTTERQNLEKKYNSSSIRQAIEKATGRKETKAINKLSKKLSKELDTDIDILNSETDQRLDKIYKQASKEWAETESKNVSVDSSILEDAAYNFLKGEKYDQFDVNTIENARKNISALANEIVKSEAKSILASTTKKSDKLKSLLKSFTEGVSIASNLQKTDADVARKERKNVATEVTPAHIVNVRNLNKQNETSEANATEANAVSKEIVAEPEIVTTQENANNVVEDTVVNTDQQEPIQTSVVQEEKKTTVPIVPEFDNAKAKSIYEAVSNGESNNKRLAKNDSNRAIIDELIAKADGKITVKETEKSFIVKQSDTDTSEKKTTVSIMPETKSKQEQKPTERTAEEVVDVVYDAAKNKIEKDENPKRLIHATSKEEFATYIDEISSNIDKNLSNSLNNDSEKNNYSNSSISMHSFSIDTDSGKVKGNYKESTLYKEKDVTNKIKNKTFSDSSISNYSVDIESANEYSIDGKNVLILNGFIIDDSNLPSNSDLIKVKNKIQKAIPNLNILFCVGNIVSQNENFNFDQNDKHIIKHINGEHFNGKNSKIVIVSIADIYGTNVINQNDIIRTMLHEINHSIGNKLYKSYYTNDSFKIYNSIIDKSLSFLSESELKNLKNYLKNIEESYSNDISIVDNIEFENGLNILPDKFFDILDEFINSNTLTLTSLSYLQNKYNYNGNNNKNSINNFFIEVFKFLDESLTRLSVNDYSPNNKIKLDYAKNILSLDEYINILNDSTSEEYYNILNEYISEKSNYNNSSISVNSNEEINTTFYDNADRISQIYKNEDASVDAESIRNKINIKKGSTFTVGKYSFSVQYSRGVGTRNLKSRKNDETVRQDGGYRIEIRDKNRVLGEVCEDINIDTTGEVPDSMHYIVINEAATSARNLISAYENGATKASIPLKNGVGNKGEFRAKLKNELGNLGQTYKVVDGKNVKDRFNARDFSNNEDGFTVISIGNYDIVMTSVFYPVQTKKNKDHYLYSIYRTDVNSDKPISSGEWLMEKNLGPEWIITEDIHHYEVENGTKLSIGESQFSSYKAPGIDSSKRNTKDFVYSQNNNNSLITNDVNNIHFVTEDEINKNKESEEEKRQKAIDEYNEEQQKHFDDVSTLYEQESEDWKTEYLKSEKRMSDEEYRKARIDDKKIPNSKNEEHSFDEDANWENAENTFGSFHNLITEASEKVQKINTIFDEDKDGKKYGSISLRIQKEIQDFAELCAGVNNGNVTIKQLVDKVNSWQTSDMREFLFRTGKVVNNNKEYIDDLTELGNNIISLIDKFQSSDDFTGFTYDQKKRISLATSKYINSVRARIEYVSTKLDNKRNLIEDIVSNSKNNKNENVLNKIRNFLVRMQGSTDSMFKAFGGFKEDSSSYKLANDVKSSVANRMRYYVQALSYFDNVKNEEGFEGFKNNTDRYTLKSLDNKELDIQQIVSIYRMIKSVLHTSGLSFDDITGVAIKNKDNSYEFVEFPISDTNKYIRQNYVVNLSNECRDIIEKNKAALAYTKACDDMFDDIGVDLNDLREELTGLGLGSLGYGNYTPIHWISRNTTSENDWIYNPDKEYLEREPGFFNERHGKEDNYLSIKPISQIVENYIQNASEYLGLAKLKTNLEIFNTESNFSHSISNTLGEYFGKDFERWYNNYLDDLILKSNIDSGLLSNLRGVMAGGTLMGSPSVIMKQSSSFFAATGLLDPEAIKLAYANKLGFKNKGYSSFNELLKYREINNELSKTFAMSLSDDFFDKMAEKSKAVKLFKKGIEQKDFVTVEALYMATVYDRILAHIDEKDFDITSKEFQKEVDDLFMEVEFRSQPMFDVELRPEYNRTDNELIRLLSMFRTQQTQNLNLIATAIGEYNAYKGTDKAKEKKDKLVNTSKGQIAAAISLSLLTIAADAMLHNLKKYRDDEDEKISIGKILQRLFINTVEGASSTIWMGDTLAKKVIDIASGGDTSEYYGVNMGPLTTVQNMMDSISYAVQSPTPSNIKNVLTYGTQIMGIPANNVYRLLNTAIMYTCDITGQNPSDYDDILKKAYHDFKTNEKNANAQSALMDEGLGKKASASYIYNIDSDDSGLTQKELKAYYKEHPDQEELVNILWDAMGFSNEWDSAKNKIDKELKFENNPLYSLVDSNTDSSVSQDEIIEYYLENKDKKNELAEIWSEQGWSSSFEDKVTAAENKAFKQETTDAYETGDTNLLFDNLSSMKNNGKSFLTSLIQDDTGDYETSSTNLLLDYIYSSNLSDLQRDTFIPYYASEKYVNSYKTLRGFGYSSKECMSMIDIIDANGNSSITQAELAEYYMSHKDDESLIAELWDNMGWSKTWSAYKKSKKIA